MVSVSDKTSSWIDVFLGGEMTTLGDRSLIWFRRVRYCRSLDPGVGWVGLGMPDGDVLDVDLVEATIVKVFVLS